MAGGDDQADGDLEARVTLGVTIAGQGLRYIAE